MKRFAQIFLILLLCLSVLGLVACKENPSSSEGDGVTDNGTNDGNTDGGSTDNGNTDNGGSTEDGPREPYASTYGDNVVDFDTIA